ncbi:hypothetical protein [Actinomycetospora succinea]|uniref:hypothetical protein n=1 Tax=Actinomycetospora succinea TaxID=663603 RepID=UPI0031E862F3
MAGTERPASVVDDDPPDTETRWTPLPGRAVRAAPAEPAGEPAVGEQAEDADQLRGIPVPATPAEAPPLPETRASSPALRPPPPPAEEEDDARTDERPLPADPFPPPFRWSAQDADAGTSPDTTQVVPDAPGPAADRTQVVARDEPAPEATQVVRRRPEPPPPLPPPRGAATWRSGPARPGPPPPPERTQFVPGAVPARAAGGGVARPEDTAPPWASAAARSEGLQGRELFARGPGPRAGVILGTVALLLLVAIVLVASIALA